VCWTPIRTKHKTLSRQKYHYIRELAPYESRNVLEVTIFFSTLFKISKIFGGETCWDESIWKTGKKVDLRETDYDNISTKYSKIKPDIGQFCFISGVQFWYFVTGCLSFVLFQPHTRMYSSLSFLNRLYKFS